MDKETGEQAVFLFGSDPVNGQRESLYRQLVYGVAGSR
jgi:hypothetical protein